MTTQDRLAEIEARWPSIPYRTTVGREQMGFIHVWFVDDEGRLAHTEALCAIPYRYHGSWAEPIAKAFEDVPWLITLCRRQQAVVEAARRYIDWTHGEGEKDPDGIIWYDRLVVSLREVRYGPEATA